MIIQAILSAFLTQQKAVVWILDLHSISQAVRPGAARIHGKTPHQLRHSSLTVIILCTSISRLSPYILTLISNAISVSDGFKIITTLKRVYGPLVVSGMTMTTLLPL